MGARPGRSDIVRFRMLEDSREYRLVARRGDYPRLVFNCNVDLTFLGKPGRPKGDEGRWFSASKSLELAVRRKIVMLFLEID